MSAMERYFGSLRARLAIMVSIAVLPLGVVAVMQTAAVVNEARNLERSDVLRRTLAAVGTEVALLRQAYGSAEALGAAAADVGSDDPLCERIMRSFADENSFMVFAGFIDIDGIMRCSSTGDRVDFGGTEEWDDFIARPRPTAMYTPQGAASGEPVLIASMPIYSDGGAELLGLASVSISGVLLNTLLNPEFDEVELALVDAAGNTLAAYEEAADLSSYGIVPSELPITNGGYTGEVTTADGEERLAVLVPLIGDRVYVLGIWSGTAQAFLVPFFGTGAPLFPILMWLIALGVSIFAIERLVLRHIRQLRRRMAHFSMDDPSDSYAVLDDAPKEISQIAGTYNRMVDRILADRTELSEALGEKELLLREVHHRVKNNLQLIASMINIQIRSVPDGQSRRILRRMQDRVMGLSSIHKQLYANNVLEVVRADLLLREVLQSTLNIALQSGSGVKTSLSLDPVALDPDEAVPLTLLASELTTNAVKYVGQPKGGRSRIDVALERTEHGVTLCTSNTIGEMVQDDVAETGTGLGSQLIEAFISQLNGEMQVEKTETHHIVRIHFDSLDISDHENTEDTDEDALDEDLVA